MKSPNGNASRDLARVAVLLSGRGSNFLALHAAMERGELPARIVLVASDKASAQGLEYARELGLRAVAVPRRGEPSRAAHEAKLIAELESAEPAWICLAGYMRLLSPEFVARYPNRILNIHPSLLPSFPGLDVQRQAIEYGARVSGCTVHLVDAGLDTGPIVAQRTVPIEDEDSPETLAARILVEEHKAYPRALRRLLTERWEVEGRRVRFSTQ